MNGTKFNTETFFFLVFYEKFLNFKTGFFVFKHPTRFFSVFNIGGGNQTFLFLRKMFEVKKFEKGGKQEKSRFFCVWVCNI